MRILYIYNPNNSVEAAAKERVLSELGSLVELVEAIDFMQVRDQYRIRETPALITIRDDLQGSHLLTEDAENANFRVYLEAVKALEEEEKNFLDAVANRIDNVVNTEAAVKAKIMTEAIRQDQAAMKAQMEATASAIDFILMNFAPVG